MTDDTCTFTYVATKDYASKITTGVERTWRDLKIEFGRTGEGLPGARYFKTISPQGPQLFAVKTDDTVWYHDENKWHKYQTAADVKFGTRELTNANPKGQLSLLNDNDDEPNFGEQDETYQ